MNTNANGVKICATCRFYATDGRCFQPDSMVVDRVTGSRWKTARDRRAASDFGNRDLDPCGFDGKQWEGGRPNEDLGGCIWALVAAGVMVLIIAVLLAVF